MHRQFHALIAFGMLLGFQAIWFTASSLLGSLPKPPADGANLFRNGVIPSALTGGPPPSADGLVEYVLWTIQRRATVESLNNLNGFVNPTHFLAPGKEPEIPSLSDVNGLQPPLEGYAPPQ
jgi:hypothetical protein